MIEWDTGETTDEALSLIIQDDPITCVDYAKKHGLLNTPGWKHLKKYVKTSKRLLRAAKQFKIRQVRKAIKYQFGYQVPRNYEDALRLDMENGNHKWQDAHDSTIYFKIHQTLCSLCQETWSVRHIWLEAYQEICKDQQKTPQSSQATQN